MLTEKGKEALENLLADDYFKDKIFTSKDVGIGGIILNGVAREGYLNKFDTKPVTYSLAKDAKEEYERRKPKSFSSYSFKEFEKQSQMSYLQLCDYLIDKYGIVDGNYFLTETCASQNQKIKRKKEGLYIHHIREDQKIMLNVQEHALECPFEWQMGANLVYANIFEHLLLHMLISLENKLSMSDNLEICGIGGVINYMGPILYARYEEKKHCENDDNPTIEEISFSDYKEIMEEFFEALAELNSLGADMYKEQYEANIEAKRYV